MVSPNLCVPFNLLASYTSSVLEKFIANLVNRCRFAFIRIQCSMAENSVIQLKSKREKMSKAKMKREKKYQINFECKIKRWRWIGIISNQYVYWPFEDPAESIERFAVWSSSENKVSVIFFVLLAEYDYSRFKVNEIEMDRFSVSVYCDCCFDWDSLTTSINCFIIPLLMLNTSSEWK